MNNSLKNELQPEWLAFMEHHLEHRQIKAGEAIIKEGEAVQGLFFIKHGKAKVTCAEETGERLIRLAGDGDILGHRGFGGDWCYPVTGTALVPTTIDFLPLPVFEVIAKANGRFGYKLMMFFAEELRMAEDRRLYHPVVARIISALLMNHRAFGFEEGSDLLSFTITRRDIASFAGTTYESVIRGLADLSRRGLIRLEGKAIGIPDLDALALAGTER